MSISYILAFKKMFNLFISGINHKGNILKKMILVITKAVNLVQLWHKPCGRWRSRQFIKQMHKKIHNPPPNPEIIHHWKKKNEWRKNLNKTREVNLAQLWDKTSDWIGGLINLWSTY